MSVLLHECRVLEPCEYAQLPNQILLVQVLPWRARHDDELLQVPTQ